MLRIGQRKLLDIRIRALKMNKKLAAKPSEIINFEEVFEKHPANSFVRGKWIFDSIYKRLNSKKVKSQIITLIGEAGIGKTALVVNYLRQIENNAVFYFLEDKKPDRLNPTTFTKHIYASLSWIHEFKDISEISTSKDAPIELLRKRIREISRKKLARGTQQLIIVDGLDEALEVFEGSLSIIDILCGLDLPQNFKLIMTSRVMPELFFFKEPSQSNVLLLAGNKKENLQDLENFLISNLSSRGVKPKDIRLLLDRSQGNFQYAVLFLEMIREKEADVEWILSNPPYGLEGIYEWKLQKISSRVKSPEVRKNIWKVMRTISLLITPQTPLLISQMNGLNDPMYNRDVFGPLEQFFDLVLYNGGQGKCRWYHSSFKDYVLDSKRFFDSERVKLYRDIARYGEREIKKGRIEGLPRDFIYSLPLYHDHKFDLLQRLEFTRNNYLPHLDPRFYKDSNNRLQAVMMACFRYACDSKRPQDRLYFYCFYEAKA